MLVPLDDEGDFLLLMATPATDEGDESSWVVRIGGECDGWVLVFDSGLPEDLDEDTPMVYVDVTVELLDAQPTGLGRFSEVVEVSTLTTAYIAEGFDIDVTAPQDQAYRLRFSKDLAGLELLVQSWPAPPGPTAVLRATEVEVPRSRVLDGLEGVEEALAAARRIGDDVDHETGCRVLSGELGVSTARVVVPGTPADHADYFDQVHVWTPDPDGTVNGSFSTPWDRRDPDNMWEISVMPHPEHLDRITGWRGAIWTKPHPEDHHPPERSVLWWRWVRREPHPDPDMGMGPPVLAQDTMRVAQLTPVPGEPQLTEITIEHHAVPVEWVDDLSLWWSLQLAIHAKPDVSSG